MGLTSVYHRIRLKGWSVLLFAVLAVTLPLASLNLSVSAVANISWSSTTNYSTNIKGASCVSYGGYVYCVGLAEARQN